MIILCCYPKRKKDVNNPGLKNELPCSETADESELAVRAGQVVPFLQKMVLNLCETIMLIC